MLSLKEILWGGVALLAALAAGCSGGKPGQCADDRDCGVGICHQGDCLEGFTRDCESPPCPEGFACREKICVDLSCLGVECGESEECARAVCYPRDCTSRNCPGLGEVCVGEECLPVTCVGIECPAEQLCAAGGCYPTNCSTTTCQGYGEVCLEDECVERTCVGIVCPSGQVCAGGYCYPGSCEEVSCPADHVCVAGSCQRATCVLVICADGLRCANGLCLAADCATSACQEDEVCFLDQCVQADCVGVVCPEEQVCRDGMCQVDPCAGIECDDHNQCTSETCDWGFCTVQSSADGLACDDGFFCTEGTVCSASQCGGGTARNCSDQEPCTEDSCDEASGICRVHWVQIPGTEGLAVSGTCTDNLDNDCDGEADGTDPDCQACQQDTDCEDGNPCTINTCDGAYQCQTVLAQDATPCSDGNFCTEPDTCTAGVCGGPERDCSFLDTECAIGDCNQDINACVAIDQVVGTPCGNPAPTECSAPDSCDGAGTCLPNHASAGTGCDDGQFCSGADSCDGQGACDHTPLPASTYCMNSSVLVECNGSGGEVQQQTCAGGCSSGATPDRCYRVVPSNFSTSLLCVAPLTDLNIASPTTADTTACTLAGKLGTIVNQGAGVPELCVIGFDRVTISATLTVSGSRALALVGCRDVIVSSTIRVCGSAQSAGAGGFAGGLAHAVGSGPGAGGAGSSYYPGDIVHHRGGGGAGYGGVGGTGGESGGAGGLSYGDSPVLVPLRGGSGGGGGGCMTSPDGGLGGGGGGAVQLVSAQGQIQVQSSGVLNACGAGGRTSTDPATCAGGGGGAGGGILLEAFSVTVMGTLAANGGGGGGGNDLFTGDTPPFKAPGEDGQAAALPAAGGSGGGAGASGGEGGYGPAPNGVGGGTAYSSGGGGGAAGRIRINTPSGTASVSGVVTPSGALFTLGTIGAF